MVINVFGLPRAGKSTFLAYCAKRALSGKSISVGTFGWRVHIGEFAPYEHVYSNFPLKGCCKMDFDDFGKIDFSNSLCLIDEISLYADARDYKTFSKVIKEYFALHGHYKNDIIICSQNFEDSDKRIRNLAAILLQVDKFGAFSRVRPIRRGQDVIHGENFTIAPPLSSTWLYRKPFYKMFDSFSAPALVPNPSELWSFGVSAADHRSRPARRSEPPITAADPPADLSRRSPQQTPRRSPQQIGRRPETLSSAFALVAIRGGLGGKAPPVHSRRRRKRTGGLRGAVTPLTETRTTPPVEKRSFC